MCVHRFSHHQSAYRVVEVVTVSCLHIWFIRIYGVCLRTTHFMCWLNIHLPSVGGKQSCSSHICTMSKGIDVFRRCHELKWTREVSCEKSKELMDTSCGNHRPPSPLPVWAHKMAAASSGGQEGDEMRSLSTFTAGSARLVRLKREWRMEEQSTGNKTVCWCLFLNTTLLQIRSEPCQLCRDVHINKEWKLNRAEQGGSGSQNRIQILHRDFDYKT